MAYLAHPLSRFSALQTCL
jgi:hypothetical protein